MPRQASHPNGARRDGDRGRSEQISRRSFHAGVKKPETRKWYSLIDKILALPNMEEAFREVKRNRGTAGIDKITIKAFENGLKDNVQILQQELQEKTYKPRPVKRVYIPKADGSERPLGIPTVRDRVVHLSYVFIQ